MTQAGRDAAGPASRERLRRRRLVAFRAALVAVLPVLATGWLLAAPHELAGVRLASMALAWWATVVGFLGLLVALALRPGEAGADPDSR